MFTVFMLCLCLFGQKEIISGWHGGVDGTLDIWSLDQSQALVTACVEFHMLSLCLPEFPLGSPVFSYFLKTYQ